MSPGDVHGVHGVHPQDPPRVPRLRGPRGAPGRTGEERDGSRGLFWFLEWASSAPSISKLTWGSRKISAWKAQELCCTEGKGTEICLSNGNYIYMHRRSPSTTISLGTKKVTGSPSPTKTQMFLSTQKN